MQPGKLSAGQVIGVFLVSLVATGTVLLGFVMLVRPALFQPALPPDLPTALPQPAQPTQTPFQPLPTPTALPPTPEPTPSPIPPSPTPEPSPTPLPWPPPAASIENISGYPQTYTLSCESRSAVDWAHFFGIEIDETEFLQRLPLSDDPEIGFVGYYNDFNGQVPPYSYGVHADPVAKLLRDYGLPSSGLKGLSLDDLRSEIAAGRPVIVWIIYGVSSGYALDYTPADGQTTLVAPYEHTVIVIGYDADSITVLDGAWIYQRSIGQFMDSWQVLGNMALIYQPEE